MARLTVNLAPPVYQILQELARRKSTTMTEILRDALALEKYVQDARDEGARFHIVDRNGGVKELVPR